MTAFESLPYRDSSLSNEARMEDLLARMTLAEKAGQLFHTMVAPGTVESINQRDTQFDIPAVKELVTDRFMTHFNILGSSGSAAELAEWHNAVQAAAAQTRLGIPVTISTDPRHSFTDNVGTGLLAGPFSQWPESLGLAAVGDPRLVEEFADIARQEYLAVGIRTALHPQIDLTTEPRWSRVAATFGESLELTQAMASAYIRGFQGPEFGPQSVSTMTKHFPGGGPQKDGTDPHFANGREQVYPGNQFEHHLAPFISAIADGTRQMMPYYGMPVGTQYEEVGFAFNKAIITDLLRTKLGFDGVVCTDWGLITDDVMFGIPFPARAWGVEHLSRLERIVRLVEAGVDQFGGEDCPDLLVEAVTGGHITEARVDDSVRRVLLEKFQMGLFDNPLVDVAHAARTVGRADFKQAGENAQRRALTVLKNAPEATPTLPLGGDLRLYVEGIDEQAAAAYGQVVATPQEADAAILRLRTPYDKGAVGFEAYFHSGHLDFSEQEISRITAICAQVPTIIDIHLERPAIFPEINEAASAVTVNFGASNEALLDVLFGRSVAAGRLPFDLPSSMKAVEESRTDVPFDTASPLYRFGHGIELNT